MIDAETEATPSPAPAPEPAPLPQAEGSVRRFFRDIESAGNLEDGMEFHAAGIVTGTPSDSGTESSGLIVLYINPFTARVEKRTRDLPQVVLYEFPQDDGVYWQLWEKTRTKLEKLRSEQ